MVKYRQYITLYLNSYSITFNSLFVSTACCFNGTEYENFIHTPPCVWAPRGYQADSFLYAMTKTYMLSMPVISNGQGGLREYSVWIEWC
jgi:hypothetical protein